MTPKTMRSSRNQINRAQIERENRSTLQRFSLLIPDGAAGYSRQVECFVDPMAFLLTALPGKFSLHHFALFFPLDFKLRWTFAGLEVVS
jgi:hypothetical protein